VALGAVRISLGRTTTEDDVTEAVDRLGRVFRRLRA
jgi:cysteine sulfinate desulfinase/cysteine desulfurase-like protein